jgi:hypothetical protein
MRRPDRIASQSVTFISSPLQQHDMAAFRRARQRFCSNLRQSLHDTFGGFSQIENKTFHKVADLRGVQAMNRTLIVALTKDTLAWLAFIASAAVVWSMLAYRF